MPVIARPERFRLTKCQNFFVVGELFGGAYYLPLCMFLPRGGFQELFIVSFMMIECV